MKIAKIILSIITILFAILGLLKVFSYDITMPIMMIALATLLVLRGVEYKMKRDRGGFALMLATALFVYAVIIYNLFIG